MANKAFEHVTDVSLKIKCRRLAGILVLCVTFYLILLMLKDIRQLYSLGLFTETNHTLGLLLEFLFGIPLLFVPLFVSFLFLSPADRIDIAGKLIMLFSKLFSSFLPIIFIIVLIVGGLACLLLFCEFLQGLCKTLGPTYRMI